MHFHFDIVDPKLRRDPLRYVLQCLLVVLALSVVLAVGDALARAVVIAAIGSTAFVLFISRIVTRRAHGTCLGDI